MSKKRPHYAHTFLHRQGIKIMPSQNFLDKFKEFYVEINNNYLDMQRKKLLVRKNY